MCVTLGGWEVMEGRLSIGGLVAMQLIAGLLLAPIVQIVMLARTLQETQAQMNRVLDVLDYKEDQGPGTENENRSRGSSIERLGGSIEGSRSLGDVRLKVLGMSPVSDRVVCLRYARSWV